MQKNTKGNLEHLTKLLCIRKAYFVSGRRLLYKQLSRHSWISYITFGQSSTYSNSSVYEVAASTIIGWPASHPKPETKTLVFGATIHFVRYS